MMKHVFRNPYWTNFMLVVYNLVSPMICQILIFKTFNVRGREQVDRLTHWPRLTTGSPKTHLVAAKHQLWPMPILVFSKFRISRDA